VRLPEVEASSFIQPAQNPRSHRVYLDGRSILIVDDDESTREVVAAALEAAHADVRVAASAAEAKERLQQHAASLIIADLGMPVEDEFALIRDIRERQASDVPAIALSAYADHLSREAALAAGFNAFLAKPHTGRCSAAARRLTAERLLASENGHAPDQPRRRTRFHSCDVTAAATFIVLRYDAAFGWCTVCG
jgi:CheY-like chemotaxis protein